MRKIPIHTNIKYDVANDINIVKALDSHLELLQNSNAVNFCFHFSIKLILKINLAFTGLVLMYLVSYTFKHISSMLFYSILFN